MDLGDLPDTWDGMVARIEGVFESKDHNFTSAWESKTHEWHQTVDEYIDGVKTLFRRSHRPFDVSKLQSMVARFKNEQMKADICKGYFKDT